MFEYSIALSVVFCQLLSIVNGQYVFADKVALVTAVAAWIADETAATSTYGLINTWDVSQVTDMSELFKDKGTFNGDISGWDVSSVTTMQEMFRSASAFNGDISGWDVSSVTTMEAMFVSANAFNGDISGWDVSSVTTMYGMFRDVAAFNGDINDWDVGSVTDMMQMFFNAASFNRQLCWDVSGKTVTDMFTGTNGAATIVCAPPTSQPTGPTGLPTSQPRLYFE